MQRQHGKFRPTTEGLNQALASKGFPQAKQTINGPNDIFDDADDEDIGISMPSSQHETKESLVSANKSNTSLLFSSSQDNPVVRDPQAKSVISENLIRNSESTSPFVGLNEEERNQKDRETQSNHPFSSNASPSIRGILSNNAPDANNRNYHPNRNHQQHHQQFSSISLNGPSAKRVSYRQNPGVPSPRHSHFQNQNQYHPPGHYAQPPKLQNMVSQDQHFFQKRHYQDMNKEVRDHEGLQQQQVQQAPGSHSHHENHLRSQTANMHSVADTNRTNHRNQNDIGEDRRTSNQSFSHMNSPQHRDPRDVFGAADAILTAAAKLSENTTAAKPTPVNKPKTLTNDARAVTFNASQRSLFKVPSIPKLSASQTANVHDASPNHENQKREREKDNDDTEVPNKVRITDEIPNKVRINTPVFLAKTYQMINECDPKICCWTDDGEMFIVKDQAKLTKAYISRFFNHSNFSSFTRQLNFYGFRKIFPKPVCYSKSEESESESANHLTFYNENFRRDRPELLKLIRRSATKSSGSNQGKDGEIEEFKEQISSMKNDVSLMSTEMQSKMTSMSSDVDRRVMTLQTQYDSKISAVISHYDDKISSLTYNYDAKIAKLASQFERRVAKAMLQQHKAQRSGVLHTPSAIAPSPSIQGNKSENQELKSEPEGVKTSGKSSDIFVGLNNASASTVKSHSSSPLDGHLKQIKLVIAQENHNIKALGQNEVFVSELIEDDEKLKSIMASCQENNSGDQDLFSTKNSNGPIQKEKSQNPMHLMLLSPDLLKKILEKLGLEHELPGTHHKQ